jgi:hypothetical protein
MEVAVKFKQGGKEKYTAFWKKYKRPPLREYWDYIIDRRDLLVPQDIRERKGSFFTPQKWVALSQQYIADVLGEDWQDEYYVWDCAAGTGNLLVGLTNKYNIWASTLDKADVDVMHERIDKGADLLHDHVFQFDFLNDEFTKLPKGLQDIINDPKKRNKLVIYINPPYAESGNKATLSHMGKNKSKVAESTIYDRYQGSVGTAMRELFAQFLIRIYCELPTCKIANFSKLKNLQSSNFTEFRQHFRAKLEKIFLVPADTFDNVKGKFPIGFYLWDTAQFIGKKTIHPTPKGRLSVDWLRNYFDKLGDLVGYLRLQRNDIQHKDGVFITNSPSKMDFEKREVARVTPSNLTEMCIYYAIRQSVDATWLNDRDQFLYPNDGWKTDMEFQNDCLAYTLFNNNIQSAYGANNWIPFTEAEVKARDRFDSRFMTDFMAGKIRREQSANLFSDSVSQGKPVKLEFSPEAREVFDAGRELWKYYHAQTGNDSNVNASLYDIREHFQGRNDKGKMNLSSTDEHYNELISALRSALKSLARKIEPKVYEYGFLKE